jgi:hypothetical protein
MSFKTWLRVRFSNARSSLAAWAARPPSDGVMYVVWGERTYSPDEWKAAH